MRTSTTSPQASLQHRPRLWRWLLALCAIVFAMQMLASTTHSHELAGQLDDCVACQVANHFPADVPSTPPALLAVFLAIAYVLARLPSAPAFVASPRYLIPPRQAPPRIAA